MKNCLVNNFLYIINMAIMENYFIGGKFMDKKHIDENENVDKYGEFVCSYFAWLQPSSQKEKAKELSNMTKKKEEKS